MLIEKPIRFAAAGVCLLVAGILPASVVCLSVRGDTIVVMTADGRLQEGELVAVDEATLSLHPEGGARIDLPVEGIRRVVRFTCSIEPVPFVPLGGLTASMTTAEDEVGLARHAVERRAARRVARLFLATLANALREGEVSDVLRLLRLSRARLLPGEVDEALSGVLEMLRSDVRADPGLAIEILEPVYVYVTYFGGSARLKNELARAYMAMAGGEGPFPGRDATRRTVMERAATLAGEACVEDRSASEAEAVYEEARSKGAGAVSPLSAAGSRITEVCSFLPVGGRTLVYQTGTGTRYEVRAEYGDSGDSPVALRWHDVATGSSWESRLVLSDEGLRESRQVESDVVLLALPLAEGYAWGWQDESSIWLRRYESLDSSVSTPVGAFSGCVKVESRSLFFSDRCEPLEIVSYQYYAPGIGLVKVEMEDRRYRAADLALVEIAD